jgi:hypothetical protein
LIGFSDNIPVYENECPTSLVGPDLWSVIDLFFMCHSTTPGVNGNVLNRSSLPYKGSLLDQDNWLMWAFSVIERAFYDHQRGDQAENQRMNQTKQTMEKMKRG